jgi:hypothetical protein
MEPFEPKCSFITCTLSPFAISLIAQSDSTQVSLSKTDDESVDG